MPEVFQWDLGARAPIKVWSGLLDILIFAYWESNKYKMIAFMVSTMCTQSSGKGPSLKYVDTKSVVYVDCVSDYYFAVVCTWHNHPPTFSFIFLTQWC